MSAGIVPPSTGVPPNDLDAESTILSAVLEHPEALAMVRAELDPQDFYSDANRRIFETAIEIADEGGTPDIVTVPAKLRSLGRLGQVGGASYVVQLLQATPAVGTVYIPDHARLIREAATKRRVIDLGRRLVVEGANGIANLGAWLDAARSELIRLAAVARPGGLTRMGVSEIFAELEPVDWLVQALDLCPGAPALVAGLGFSGKTVAVQSLAVSLASGLAVWGTFHGKGCARVLHLDYEQGPRLTRERYQRLAAGMLLGPGDLGGLELVSMPSLYLDAPQAADELMRATEDIDLVIIDSLRAACPSLEENDSGARRVLDTLTRVSEQTGCVPLVIHHARKPSKEAAGGARAAIRGTGALFDACSSVFVLEGDGGGDPTRVAHVKARTSGRLADDFLLRIEDVELDGNPRAGLAVRAEAPQDTSTRSGAADAAVDEAVLATVGAHPGASGRQVWSSAGVRSRESVLNSLARLELAGRLEGRPGPRRSVSWFVKESPQ